MKTETSRDNEHEEDIATRLKFETLCEGAGTTSTKKTSQRGQSSRHSVRGSRRCRCPRLARSDDHQGRPWQGQAGRILCRGEDDGDDGTGHASVMTTTTNDCHTYNDKTTRITI